MRILEVISGYMTRQGMTVTELAKVTMIGRVNLGYKLKGKCSMSVEDLRLIVNALDITAEDLKRGLSS